MDFQELAMLLSGIDFTGFDAWWKFANPSITYQVTQAQANPVSLTIVIFLYSDGKFTLKGS
jgi:hypothetical protein